MRGPRHLLLILALLVALGDEAAAGAWTREAGGGYLRLSYSVLSTDEFYGADKKRVEVGDYDQHVVGCFIEVGLVDRWLTLSLDGTVYRWNHLDGQGTTSGVGDWRIGLWSGLVTAPFRLSAGLLVGLPTGDDVERLRRELPPGISLPPELEFPASVSNNLPNGDGELDVELRLAFGSDMRWLGKDWPLRHYAELELGFVYHTDLDEAVTWSLKLGTKIPGDFAGRFWFTLILFGVESLASEDDVEPILTGFGNGVSFTAFAFEVTARIVAELELSVRVDGALRARALPAGAPITFALSYTF